MEGAEKLKKQEDNFTVNFENLHANMALNSATGEGVESQKENGDQVEANGEMKISEEGKIGDLENGDEISEESELQIELNEVQLDTETPKNQLDEENKGTEQSVEDVAKEIIKNAVDGAKEQVLLQGDAVEQEKSSDNKKENEWLDILGNGSLKKKVLSSGEGEESRPKREQEVTIKYTARLKDEEEIVESDDNLVFILSEQEVLDVFDLAVALMERGEKAVVECAARYAYGEAGKPPKIPPNSDIIFEIELLDIKDGPFTSTIDLERRLAWADEKRQKGNKFYSEKKYAEASKAYTRSTKSLEKGWMSEESKEARIKINEMRLKCYNNLTASQMKEEKFKEAQKSCRAAEKLEPNNVKTLFRKGKIHCELGELEKGIAALTKAADLEPENKTITAELTKQKRKLEKQNQSQKKMYQRMLGTTNETPKTTQPEKSWFRSWGRVLGSTLAVGAVLIGMYIAQKN